MLPSAYNNNVQILQTPDTIVIFNEMVHNARVVPLDGRAHLRDDVRLWTGNARGRWEGSTLVVETRNFLRETGFAGTGMAWSNGSSGWTPTRCATSSPSRTRSASPSPGPRPFR